MAKKMNPQDVDNTFIKKIVGCSLYLGRVETAIQQTGLSRDQPNSDLITLYEQCFGTSAVALESFISEYFVACANRDASALIAHCRQRLTQSVQSNFGPVCGGAIRLPVRSHPSFEVVRSLLAPSDWNVTFKDAAGMKQRAAQVLAAPYVTCVAALTQDDECVINCVKAIRNYLAYRSTFSGKAMNDTLASLARHHNVAHLARNVTTKGNPRHVQQAGTYLRAVTGTPPQARLLHYFDHMKLIADRLLPETVAEPS